MPLRTRILPPTHCYPSPPCHLPQHRIGNDWYSNMTVGYGISCTEYILTPTYSDLPITVLCFLRLAVTMTGRNCIRYADRGLAIGRAEKYGSIAVRMCCTDNLLRHDATIWKAKISGVTGEDWDDSCTLARRKVSSESNSGSSLIASHTTFNSWRAHQLPPYRANSTSQLTFTQRLKESRSPSLMHINL